MSIEEDQRLPVQDMTEGIDLGAIVQAFWRQRILMASIVALATLLGLVLGFTLPKAYSSQATILPMAGADSSGALAAGLASQLGIPGMLGGTGASKTADLVEILSSRSMADRVITKLALQNELKGKTSRSKLVTRVQGMVKVVAPTLKSKVITIKVTAPKAELAARITEGYVSELKVMLDEIGYNSAARTRRFIGKQLDTAKQGLAKAEERLADFQSQNRLASLPETVIASIKSVSELEAQRTSTEIQLRSTEEEASLVKARVSALQADPNALVELEMKRSSLIAKNEALAKAQGDFTQKLVSLPPKGMALARLQRDVQVQNAIYLTLSQQYETAVINENKESDAFLPLDRAEVPELPIKPRKKVVLVLSMAAGLLLGAVVALGLEYLRLYKRPTNQASPVEAMG